MRRRHRHLTGPLIAGLLVAAGATPAAAYDDDWQAPRAAAQPAPPYAAAAPDPGELWGFDFTPDTCAEAQRMHQALGGLLGGVTGGLIGSGIGKGSGKTVATISGALLGTFGGAFLGTKVADAGVTCLPDPDEPGSANLFDPLP